MLKAAIRMMIISRQQIRHWREVKWNGFNVERSQREEKAERSRHMTNFKLVVRNRLVSIFIAWYELMSCCDSRWMVTRTGDAMSVDSPARNIQLCAMCWLLFWIFRDVNFSCGEELSKGNRCMAELLAAPRVSMMSAKLQEQLKCFSFPRNNRTNARRWGSVILTLLIRVV